MNRLGQIKNGSERTVHLYFPSQKKIGESRHENENWQKHSAPTVCLFPRLPVAPGLLASWTREDPSFSQSLTDGKLSKVVSSGPGLS